MWHVSFLVMPIIRLLAWLILLTLIFVPLERLFALRPGRIFRSGFPADLSYFFINGIVPALVLSTPLAAVAIAGHSVIPPNVAQTFAALPLGLRILASMVVAEFGLYWAHRLSHEIPMLWRFHAVHHSPTHVDWLVNSRGHPVDFIFTRLCGLLPIYALGLGTPLQGDASIVPLLAMVIGPTWGFFIHANISWRFGPLEWLIATPAFHHWHHANDDPGVINKNYAPMFPWVDWMFGSLHLPRDRQPSAYGINTAVPSSLLGQLLAPCKKLNAAQPPTAMPQPD